MRTGIIFSWRGWFFEQLVIGVGFVSIALAVTWGMMAVMVMGGQAAGVNSLPSVTAKAAPEQLSLSIHPSLPTIVTVTGDPWELSSRDLMPQRVVYNILTKAGFRWLFVQVLSGVLVVWGVMHVSHRVVAWSTANRPIEKAVETTREVAGKGAGVVIEIAGTVKVTSKMGVIYKGMEALTSGTGENEYALAIGGFEVVKLRVTEPR